MITSGLTNYVNYIRLSQKIDNPLLRHRTQTVGFSLDDYMYDINVEKVTILGHC